MRKETTLNQIILGTIARVVRHANFHTELVGQLLQSVLEEILVGSVAAATVAQPQDRGCLGITPFANAIPIPAKALTGKLAGVVRPAQVDMPTVAHPIVTTVRNEHAIGPTGKSMIAGVQRLRAAHATGPKELAQMRFRFGINRKIGMASGFVLSDQMGDPLEWRIAVRGVTTGEVFGNLAQPQVLLLHPVPNHVGTNWRSHF